MIPFFLQRFSPPDGYINVRGSDDTLRRLLHLILAPDCIGRSSDNNDDNDETGCSLVFIGHHTMVHGEAL